MAEEFRAKGSHIALGPVVGPLGRSPFGGRNWEGFSPDAYLSGELVEDTIVGMQSAGVQACVKHFILNEQETQRNPTTGNGTTIEAISSNIDDKVSIVNRGRDRHQPNTVHKAMHETYLWPFANAIRAGSASVMCSYNRINGRQVSSAKMIFIRIDNRTVMDAKTRRLLTAYSKTNLASKVT
jgi:beta-glucosidase